MALFGKRAMGLFSKTLLKAGDGFAPLEGVGKVDEADEQTEAAHESDLHLHDQQRGQQSHGQQHQQPNDQTGSHTIVDADALVQGHILGPEDAGQAPQAGILLAVHGALEFAAGLHFAVGGGNGALQHIDAVGHHDLSLGGKKVRHSFSFLNKHLSLVLAEQGSSTNVHNVV